MKLLSLNTEKDTHIKNTIRLITKENPDVICLQEATSKIIEFCEELGYVVIYIPMALLRDGTETGILIAARKSFSYETYYYNKAADQLRIVDTAKIKGTVDNLILVGNIEHNNKLYTIAVTHFSWTPDGKMPTIHQEESMGKFINIISNIGPHTMCGDFNIPRKYNALYKKITEHYTDAVPSSYKTSLDRSLHRHGSNPEKTILFDEFMVDYILTQSPYTASNVRLEFGISDHAALIGTITNV